MTNARCPACGAAVAVGAPWCTLCFADLRPRPVEAVEVPAPDPVPAPVPVQAPPAAPAVTPLDPLTAPVALLTSPIGARGWPCTRCGETVAFDLDACPGCGAGFLAGAELADPGIALPVVGDVRRLGRAQKLGLIVGLSVGSMLLLLLLMVVLGHLL